MWLLFFLILVLYLSIFMLEASQFQSALHGYSTVMQLQSHSQADQSSWTRGGGGGLYENEAITSSLFYGSLASRFTSKQVHSQACLSPNFGLASRFTSWSTCKPVSEGRAGGARRGRPGDAGLAS